MGRMGSRDYAANETEVPRGTLVDLFLGAIDQFGNHTALRAFVGNGPELSSISYRHAYDLVQSVVGGLRSLGLQRGARAAILSENRPEWALADYGCLCAGVCDVPVYDTLVPSQVAYILDDSGAELVFVSTREQVVKVLEAGRELGSDLHVVVFDELEDPPGGAQTWSDFVKAGRTRAQQVTDEGFRTAARQSAPDDLATLIYTSGTTGSPKGVMLTHDNLHSNVMAASLAFPIDDNDSTLSFLPLCHVLQRMVDYLFFARGCTITYARDIRTVADDLKVVRPTVAVSVPRLYEKVYNRVMDASGFKAVLVRWAERVGRAWAEEKLAGKEPSSFLNLEHRLADRLVFRKIRDAVGGRMRFFVSGGAPLEPAINKFFYGAGVVILEGYGLTETSPVTNLNTLESFKVGTVGPPVAGTEIRIAEDGEILVRGRQVMKGYYRSEEATAEAIEDDGWFHTGDIGELDEDGFLRITDRKKDIIVTSGGKNVAPQPIENRLKTNPFVEQLVMVGDRRKFVALLVVPAFDPLEAWARSNGVRYSSREGLLRDPEVHEKMEEELLDRLDGIASYETPKKLALLGEEFTIENGMLTPSLKIKRSVVQERFDHVIDGFYSEENVDRAVFAASELLPRGEDGG